LKSNHRCSRSCLSNKKRRRRDVTRGELEHEESTSKTVLTGGPIILKEKIPLKGKFISVSDNL